MRQIKLLFLLSGLGLYSCGQTDSRRTITNERPSMGRTDTGTEQVGRAGGPIDEKPDGIDTAGIKGIVALFKEKDIAKISDIIRFPLYREYPIPPIKDKEAFRKRFREIFDDKLINKIVTAQPGQWSEMGWRGIMLDEGSIWLADANGPITAVNYQSDFEKKWRKDLMDRDKEKLHPSLKTFESPTYKIKTKNYLIRIDELKNGTYRYASWKTKGDTVPERPDIILSNGSLKYEGSGGNHTITFTRENYTYRVYRNIIGEENAPDIRITVAQDGRTILKEDGVLIFE